jgi:hypothetical protein
MNDKEFEQINQKVKCKNILIGLPNTGYFHFMTVSSILGLEIPEGYTISFRFISNCLIYDAREQLCQYAVDNHFDYILMIDSDMVIPSNAIKLFIETLEKGANIITGLIFKRSYPFQPCFYAKARIKEIKNNVDGKEIIKFVPDLEGIIQWEKNSIIPIEACGMACCMIDVRILKNIKKPWFYPFPDMGEDITFCMKAIREAKAMIFLDSRVDVGHLSINTVTSIYQIEALKAWENDPNNKGKLLYMEDKELKNE